MRVFFDFPACFPPGCAALLAWAFWLGYFGFAVLVLVLRYSVLPNIESYRGDIERGISSAVGLNVTISRIDTDWQACGRICPCTASRCTMPPPARC
ncbi:MAG: hypothetical protein M5R42_07935 [Rhodocyclaceae bacterium]|nr:hypothetical protein [Rhodocyclaceae bacterium]